MKIKEYGLLLNRFITLQNQQLISISHITISDEAPISNLSTAIEQSQPSIEETPRAISSTSELPSDSGFATASPKKTKEPSLLQRLSSKVRTPFKATISANQRAEEMGPTSFKLDQPSASTPITATSAAPPEFPSTPPTSKEKRQKAPQVDTLSRR